MSEPLSAGAGSSTKGGLDRFEEAIFLDRVELLADDLHRPLTGLYGETHDVDQIAERLVKLAAARYAERSMELKRLDLRRLSQPDWFQQATMVGYAGYPDRIAGDLVGVANLIPHFESLGVTYLHLLPVLEAREGENDGGYAVASYRRVDPRLGTMEDLEALAARLRNRGISLCIDVVCNHTADTHDWARKALAGDESYQDYYLTFPDRELPDAYQQTLREIFPDDAPGSFTWVPELERWVWTTFHSYQWDLDYRNPQVLVEMADVILTLANAGADVLRLDAVAFMWKELGTMCENLPGAHAILQVFRALTRLACPGVLLEAEAIVPIDDTLRYLGVEEATGKECHLAYHHFLMVLLWSALAEGNVGLLTGALQRLPAIPVSGSWCTYIRSHDDIGWAITPDDAATVGLNDFLHRQFLTDFYIGEVAGSFAIGETFQYNPKTQDRRVCGTAASLAGVERARRDGDSLALEMAYRRLRLLAGVIAGAGGIPLIWSGDELGLTNDYSHLEDPEHAADNRWLHRPALTGEALAERIDPDTVAGRVFEDLLAVLTARKASLELHAAAASDAVPTGNGAVFGLLRSGPRGRILILANFTPHAQEVAADRLAELGFGGALHDRLTGREVNPDGVLALEPYGVMWLTVS